MCLFYNKGLLKKEIVWSNEVWNYREWKMDARCWKWEDDKKYIINGSCQSKSGMTKEVFFCLPTSIKMEHYVCLFFMLYLPIVLERTIQTWLLVSMTKKKYGRWNTSIIKGQYIKKMWTRSSDHPNAVSYTHLTLPTIGMLCRSRWSPYH